MDSPELSTAFAVWASVVLLVGGAIVWELSRLRNDVRAMSSALNNHILHTERRVTHIEGHLTSKDSNFRPAVTP